MSTRFDVWGRRVEAEIKDKTVFYTRINVESEMAQLKSCMPFSLIVSLSAVCEIPTPPRKLPIHI